MSHIHILGIGGTFMSALAILARELGHEVTGCDVNCYPPVSDLLADKGISWTEGYEEDPNALTADYVVVGNAIKRGMPVLESVLNAGQRYISGPQWIAEQVLPKYRVIAVAGTHGKTTTTSMIAHILQETGQAPGFLIGGVAPNFETSAHLGAGQWFVIEADEYDSAFFDKRPKMIHYHPEVAILNNLEFDHADIYADLAAIQQQFHYYLKTIPNKGVVIKPRDDKALNEVVARGVFSKLETIAIKGDAAWRAEVTDASGGMFRVFQHDEQVAIVEWSLMGLFNVENGLSAIAAAYHAGVKPQDAAKALGSFKPVKRRLEVKFERHGVTVYDDFAHHPTAIERTVDALKQSGKHQRILVALEFASNTMRSGVHVSAMPRALSQVDYAFVLQPSQFDLEKVLADCSCRYELLPDTAAIVERLTASAQPGDAIVLMSNRGFNNIQKLLVTALTHRFETAGL